MPEHTRAAAEENQESEKIVGRNPVIEALKAGRSVDRILVAKGAEGLGRLYAMAKDAGVPVKEVSPVKIEEESAGANAQGVMAFAAAHRYAEVEEMFQLAEERGEPPFLILADGLEDPHNLGALIRTAECCGAHGVIIPKRRSVGLSYAVSKTSAGAVEYVPVARVTNLTDEIERLKKRGLWIFCADMGGEPVWRADMSGPIGLVVGAEGEGVGRLVKEKCDFVISLPMRGKIDSLNASVAASVVMYEAARQRMGISAR
ncbi:MAG TPA: 23S rRNA (guanosine(2251)-2'-O)-methyltransferase RlmB [Oscillospiraceae bacterium]|nr:23S rRNA (guanosine(2251)-2'-O)-methyltransferase RlmB [Oscillospiraceae bacterium]HNW04368.1 23S rRNA (guanosine(2251)-2'-O)-methyltransferase RlmB [Oscillospiraceae bacterium]HPV99721.1 23S rRNA (guanosine(2251)-2'-O)-methyltransferase RlmB [Oscillospiraceae bacterium]